MAKVTITVNGVKHTRNVEDRTLLANLLRDEIATTVGDPDEVDDEIRNLMAAL